MQKSMNGYVKNISKRSEIDPKEKVLPIAHLGGTMIAHGEDFEPDSEFGQCLNCKYAVRKGRKDILTCVQCSDEHKSGFHARKKHTLTPRLQPCLNPWSDHLCK